MDWVLLYPDVACVAPLVLGSRGSVQYSVKHNPTFLSLLIGRLYVLRRISFLEAYDRWHRNLACDYRRSLIESPYLSGCFLVIPSSYYSRVGGFCEKYFLHLEDADIVRRLSLLGRCLHNPVGVVVHQWARGSHKSLSQTLYLFRSIVVYMCNWGMNIW
jgi:GT2 family glycosyltransferase